MFLTILWYKLDRYLPPHKIVNNPDFLRLLSIRVLDFAHQNAADKAVQHRFIQLLNSSILPDLPDKSANFTFLSIGLLKHSQQFLQTALIFFLLLFHGGCQLQEASWGRGCTISASYHTTCFPVAFLPAFDDAEAS